MRNEIDAHVETVVSFHVDQYHTDWFSERCWLAFYAEEARAEWWKFKREMSPKMSENIRGKCCSLFFCHPWAQRQRKWALMGPSWSPNSACMHMHQAHTNTQAPYRPQLGQHSLLARCLYLLCAGLKPAYFLFCVCAVDWWCWNNPHYKQPTQSLLQKYYDICD